MKPLIESEASPVLQDILSPLLSPHASLSQERPQNSLILRDLLSPTPSPPSSSPVRAQDASVNNAVLESGKNVQNKARMQDGLDSEMDIDLLEYGKRQRHKAQFSTSSVQLHFLSNKPRGPVVSCPPSNQPLSQKRRSTNSKLNVGLNQNDPLPRPFPPIGNFTLDPSSLSAPASTKATRTESTLPTATPQSFSQRLRPYLNSSNTPSDSNQNVNNILRRQDSSRPRLHQVSGVLQSQDRTYTIPGQRPVNNLPARRLTSGVDPRLTTPFSSNGQILNNRSTRSESFVSDQPPALGNQSTALGATSQQYTNSSGIHQQRLTTGLDLIAPGAPLSLWSSTPTVRDLLACDTFKGLSDSQRREVLREVSDNFWYHPTSPPRQHQVDPLNYQLDCRPYPETRATFNPHLPPGVDLDFSQIDPLTQQLLKYRTTNLSTSGALQTHISNTDFNKHLKTGDGQAAQIGSETIASMDKYVKVGSENFGPLGVDSINGNITDNHEKLATQKAIRLPPPSSQNQRQQPQVQSSSSLDMFRFHGKQTSVVSRPSQSAAGSSNFQNSESVPFRNDQSISQGPSRAPILLPGYSQASSSSRQLSPQNQSSIPTSLGRPKTQILPPSHTSTSRISHQLPPQTNKSMNALPGSIQLPALENFKYSAPSVNQAHAHPSTGPDFVPNIPLSPPQPPLTRKIDLFDRPKENGQSSSASLESRNHVQMKVDSLASRPLSTFGQDQSIPSIPRITGSKPKEPTTISSPSKLFSVVIDSPRSFSTPISRQINASPLPFSSLARVVIPASTPEKLAIKPFDLKSANRLITGKKRGRPQTAEGRAKLEAKAARKLARENRVIEDKKKVGRPPKLNRHVEVPAPKPEYMTFFCEWKGCKAELHNAETLRQHLYSVHGRKDAQSRKFHCLWKEDVLFDSNAKKEWKAHVDKHINNVLWYQGDGPKSQDLSLPRKNRSLRETDPWLFDEDGNQVTPSIEGQKVQDGNTKEMNEKRFKKRREAGDIVYDLIEVPPEKPRVFEKQVAKGDEMEVD